MALPRAMRFFGRREVERLLRGGQRITLPLGRLIMSRRGEGRGQVLFVISTAVAKRANVRHRIKRLLDEWARARRELLAASGMDFVIFVSKDCKDLSSRDLRDRAEDVLARIHPFSRGHR